MFSSDRWSWLSSWIYLCGSYSRCFGRYLPDHQGSRRRSAWRHHAFLLWYAGGGSGLHGLGYAHLLLGSGDLQESRRTSGSGAIASRKILVETDAPYLAPVPKRGRENRTGYTRYVVDMLAQLRNQSVEEVAKATYENARSLFRIDSEN